MNHLRRIISFLLVLVLCIGLVPGVSAAEVDALGAENLAEATETEKALPPITEETTTPEEPAPEEPPAEDSPPEESIPDAESTEPPSEDVPQNDPGIMGLSPGDSSTWAIGSTQKSIMLFDFADNGNYTTVLNSQVTCAYKPNGTGTTRTAYIKNLGWHFARYGGVAYADDPLYCIEPWRSYAASTSGNSVDRDVTLDGSGSTTGSNVWYALPTARREAIGLILLYSNQMWNHSISVTTTSKANNPNVPLRIATQFLIYEIVCGLRDPSTFTLNSTNECGTAGNIFYNAGAASVTNFTSNYNTLVSYIQAAKKIPSFTSASSGSAPTINLTGEETSVYDSNGVLSNFSFTDGSGAEFYKSGSTLYITQTGTISSSTVFKATRYLPSSANSTYNVWYMSGSSYQTTVSLASASSGNLNAYFKLKAPDPGTISLTKTTEDGQNLSGWRFGVYTNSACTSLAAGPYSTNANGKISFTGLTAGTYYVKELGHTDSSINALYTCSGTNPQKVTVTSGGTTSVSFYNKLNTGSISLTKTTEDSKNLSGWQFGIYSNSACTTLVSGPHSTDSSGMISVTGLTPGTYYVKEIGHTDSSINALYYCSSTNPQAVTVTAGGTAAVSFTNKLNTGSISLTKTTEDSKNLSGWQFGIYSNSACTTLVSGPHSTDSSGMISVTGLTPGTYYVKEIGHTDSSINALYYCSSTNPQAVTVTAGGTAAVSFTNKLNTGSISLTKTTEDGKNLSGWQFGIYSNSACTTLVSGPHSTNTSGKISVTGLTPGTYYVKELGHTDSTVNALYYCSSTNPQAVTVTAGNTATVSFTNKLNTGSVKLMKSTNTGANLSGWQIGLYTDADCTNAVSGSPFATGADGSVTVSDLSVGTLYAKEIEVDDPYWVCDTSVKTVNITAGQTATVTFRNTHYGDMRIRKNAVNGSAEGWSFQIMDSERNLVTTIKTGADGYAHSGRLLPGQYFILEVHDRDDTYWEYDPVVEKQVTITAGSQAEVAYTNTQYGKIQIQKAMETVGSLTGWQFRITDSSGTEIPGSPFATDETGLILTEKLQPGEYKVEELIPENSLYSCTSENPQTVTVKAGETAGVSFTNALRPGRILIEKVDIRGEPLADAKFLLEWSKDGSLWWPVEYTDAETVREGFCFNAKCVNGTLTSGKDGLLEWTGLHPGLMYRVTELEAPKGYSLLTEPAFEGTLPADNLTVSFHVVNCEIFKLPDTGMTSGAWLRVSQFACIFLCTALLVYSYRKERRQ